MIAPKVVRMLVDNKGVLMDAFDVDKFSVSYVRRKRNELAKVYPDRTPIAMALYDLREGAGMGKTRAVITLPPKGKKP